MVKDIILWNDSKKKPFNEVYTDEELQKLLDIYFDSRKM